MWLEVARKDGRTRLADLRQQGCLKLLFPRAQADAPLEAVMVNTSGGIVAGDRLDWRLRARPEARLVVSSQAAERGYRARDGGEVARLTIGLDVARGARVEWLPTETILFDGAAIDRRMEVDVAADGVCLVVESRVFGRTKSGEELRGVHLRDRIAVRRDGRPILIDALRLDDGGMLSRRAVAAGAVAVATIVLVSGDANQRLDPVRAVLDGDAGASAWNGMLVVRMLSHDAQHHRGRIERVLGVLRDGRPLPAVWRC